MKASHISFIMKKFMLAATSALIVFSLAGFVTPQAAKAANGVPQPDHVVWVIFENHAYNQVIGSGSAPYFDALAASGANMTFSHGVTHPSEPNYAAFFSGSTQGISSDPCPAPGAPFSSANLGAQLLAAGRTIKIFSEALPSVGYTGCGSGGYVYKHNPYVFWQGTGTNRLPSSGNVPWTAWPTDFTTLPTLSIVVPTLCNDMHDCSVATGDTWLHNNLDAYKTWAMTHNSLLIVDFDEDNMTSANVIPTIFLGQMVKVGRYGENINHYNVLRTIEDMYNLPYAGAAASASPITDIWQASGPTATFTPTATSCVSCPTNTPTPTRTATNTPLPGGVNLVLNPSFETAGTGGAADAADWTEGSLHARASDKFNTGSWALHSTFRSGGTNTHTTLAIPVIPGTAYNYSAYIWKTNSAGAAYVDMNDVAGEMTLTASTTGSWQFLSGTWNSGTNTSVTLRAVTDGSPTGDIWFDDISLAAPGGATNTPAATSTNSPTATATPVGPTNTSTPTQAATNTPLPGGVNLVLNPSFETAGTGGAADAANWTEGVNHTRASDKFHTGGWSLKSTYTGTGTSTNTTLPIAVLPNTTYTYSGYIWRASTTGGSCMDMNDIAGETQLCTTATGSWQLLSGAWNSGSNTSVTLRLITDGTPNNSIWFDDISLAVPGGPISTPAATLTNSPTATVTPLGPTNTPSATRTATNTPLPGGANLVLNPSFETAGTGGAADAANWTEGVNHTRASDKFHTGGWSLKSTYTGTGTSTNTTLPIAVLPNTTYTYSGYIWRASTTGGSCMDMNDIAGETQLCTTATGSWQLLSGAWNSGSNTSVTLRLITDGTPNNSIWFDDISLQ